MKRDEKVLVVEQNPSIRQAIEAADRFPFVCDHATDGWEAIEKLEQCDYAAIVIDSEMPRLSGYGVLTYLREEVGDQMKNVLLVSSVSEDLRRKFSGERFRVVDREGAVAALIGVARDQAE
jgi:DNA-binding response OmpR family regulator